MPVIRSEASPDDLLEAVAQLPTEELTRFAERVATLRAERVAPHASHDEAALLHQIGRGLPAEHRRRYDDLMAKRDDERLTAEEHTELLRLSDELETLDAERVEAIVALARLRGVAPAALMQSLGIQPAADGP
ncbi:MAG: STAS/SEC14 domain-containing protein [Dehalococcoidia bacterium]